MIRRGEKVRQITELIKSGGRVNNPTAPNSSTGLTGVCVKHTLSNTGRWSENTGTHFQVSHRKQDSAENWVNESLLK